MRFAPLAVVILFGFAQCPDSVRAEVSCPPGTKALLELHAPAKAAYGRWVSLEVAFPPDEYGTPDTARLEMRNSSTGAVFFAHDFTQDELNDMVTDPGARARSFDIRQQQGDPPSF